MLGAGDSGGRGLGHFVHGTSRHVRHYRGGVTPLSNAGNDRKNAPVDAPIVALHAFVRCAKPRLLPSLKAIPDKARAFTRGCGAGGCTLRSPMNALLLDYLPLAIFIAVATVLALALLIAPFIVAFSAPDPEKLSAYECGFNAFDDARMKFDVRYYLVAILFIIFDLEVSFLFPWAVAFRKIGLFGFWSMMVFLGVLTVGFIYEWRKGALEWD